MTSTATWGCPSKTCSTVPVTGALAEEGLDHYAVGMKDPEGNEFDIN